MINQESLTNIEKLHQLKTEGIITEEDFEQAKRRLFGSGPVAAAAPLAPSGSLDDHFAWMTLPLKRYADFKGRSTRKEFWMFQLIPLAIMLVCMVFVVGSTDVYGDIGTFGILALLTTVFALLGLVVPLLAVQARRFHDQGRSGWLVLINLVPYVGSLIVYVFMMLEGTEGENAYGPDPLEG